MRDFTRQENIEYFYAELKRINALEGYPLLGRFMRDMSRWELLLRVCMNYYNENPLGITKYYGELRHKTRSELTLTNFLRECVASGILEVVFIDGRRSLKPSNELLIELISYLESCYRTRPAIEEITNFHSANQN